MNIYELTVKYERAGEKGLNTKVTEQYIVRSHQCASAEFGLLKVLAPVVTGQCEVLSVKRSAVTEVITDEYGIETKVAGDAARILGNKNANTEADRYYKAKVAYNIIDEVTGKTKKHPQYFFVFAGSVEAAHSVLDSHLQKSVMDYEILSVSETKFVEYYFIKNENLEMA